MAKGVRLASKSQIVSVAKLVSELAPRKGDRIDVREELHQVMVRNSDGEPIKLPNGENEWQDGEEYSFIQLDLSRKEFELKSGLGDELASALGAASKGLLAKMRESGKYPGICSELVVKFTGGRGRSALDLGDEFDDLV